MARKPGRRGSPGSPDLPDEAELWDRVAGTVRPLRRRGPPGSGIEEAPETDEPRDGKQKTPKRARALPLRAQPPPRPCLPPLAAGSAPGLDKRTAMKLRRGLIPFEARIDLHGMTQSQAHGRLSAFLGESAAAGRRCVLVITGRGAARLAEGGGVLRAELPRWLNGGDLRPLVLAFATARPRHGGDGAFYVYLRRARRG